MKIYGMNISGNCLKVKYVCDYLNLSYEWLEIHSKKDQSKIETSEEADNKAALLKLNPAGEVPTIELEDGRVLAQSNAIILFLADKSALLPGDAYSRAKVNEWLFWEQYSHEPCIAVCISHMTLMGRTQEQLDAWRVEGGNNALDIMNQHLSDKSWFVGEQFTLADITLFAYTQKAEKGGFDISQRIHIKDWLSRCEDKLF